MSNDKLLRQFEQALDNLVIEFADGVDPAQYGGDPKKWLVEEYRQRPLDDAREMAESEVE
jgi:hypothetical protein